MKEIFESHSVKTLKGEISKYNKLTKVSGYSKMTKKELVDLMLKHKDKFKHIKMNPKPLKALPKALTSKAVKTSKEDKKEPKKEPKKVVKKVVKKIKKIVKKPEPKKEAPKKPEPKKEAPKKEAPKKEAPKKEESENEILAKEFYTNINSYLRGSKRQINYLRKIHNMPDDLINKVFENQANMDFFPTPDHCLKVFNWDMSEKVLEGTAGLGSVVYYLRKNHPNVKVVANEIDSNFSKVIKKYNPSIKVTTEDFLKIKPNNEYDGIFLNPPFRKFGRVGKKFGGKGTSQRFYMEFLFKALTLLKGLGQGYQKTIYFVSPDIVKSKDKPLTEKNLFVEEFINNIIIGKDYLKEIFKKYYNIKLSDGDLKELQKGETDIGNIEAFGDSPVSNISEIQYLGKCKGFGGTGTTANMYEIIVF